MTEGGGRLKEPGELFREKLLNATSLNDSGYVLSIEDESGVSKVDLCESTEIPWCVNHRSTANGSFSTDFPRTDFLTGADLEDIDCFKDGKAALNVTGNNAAISRGDALVVGATDGKVDLYVKQALGDTSSVDQAANINTRFTELGQIVAYADEDIPVGGGGLPGKTKVKCHLVIRATGQGA